jgi:hypothetical protein
VIARRQRSLQVWVGLVGVLAHVAVAPAAADLRQDLQSDVLASGFTDLEVVVDPVAAPGFVLNEDLEADLAFGELRPFLSPDPQAPGAVPTFTLHATQGAPLEGILQTPGVAAPAYTQLAPRILEAELAAYEAAKHAVLRGENLAGLEFIVEAAGTVATRVLISAPAELSYPPLPPSQTMSASEVEEAVRAGLPAWAAAGELSVRDDYAGERIVTLTLARPAEAFRVLDVEQLGLALGSAQVALRADGAKIGRVIVHIEDPASGDPLYSAGHDLLYGSRRTSWRSPLIAGFEPVTVPTGLTAQAARDADDAIRQNVPPLP